MIIINNDTIIINNNINNIYIIIIYIYMFKPGRKKTALITHLFNQHLFDTMENLRH